MTVRTRLAPSPTGRMHIGSIAMALKNYAFAKKHGGQFILRIEDTDKTREIEDGINEIVRALKAYGLDWDEGPEKGGPYGPYIQSQRLEFYKKYAQKLVDEAKAYYCFATKEELEKMRQEALAVGKPPRYNGMYRDYPLEKAKKRIRAGEPYVIRLKVPKDQEIVFHDLIRGEIKFDSNEVSDQVLLKSDGYPTYHLAVVVDDHLMKITHVMRGEEWISSTPKHVLLYQAFGWPMPTWAHIPVFLNPDGKGKMSKRKGDVAALDFLEKGYLKEAVLNFLMILGWTPKDQREILNLDEYVREFNPADISHNSVIFDLKKLNWLNGVYIRKLSDAKLKKRLKPFIPSGFPEKKLDRVIPLIKERLVTLADFDKLTRFLWQQPSIDSKLLLKKATPELVKKQLKLTLEALESLDDFSDQAVEQVIRKLQEKHGWRKRQYFMMLRVAVTGEKATPPLFETMSVIGQEEVVSRLKEILNSKNL